MKKLFLICLCLAGIAFGNEDRISIQAVHSATGTPADTLYAGVPYEFQVLVGVNIWVDGFDLNFLFSSENDVTWHWNAQPEGYPDTGLQAVTFFPPFIPPEDFFAFRFIIYEWDMDGISYDSLGFWLRTMDAGLGGCEPIPMMSFHFNIDDMDDIEIGSICVDSSYPFLFYWDPGVKGNWHPEFDGSFCWPVKKFVWGDFDMDGEITVGDPVELIQYIFFGKPNKGPIEAGDANCDGDTNIGDAIYLIAYIFQFGPPPGCP